MTEKQKEPEIRFLFEIKADKVNPNFLFIYNGSPQRVDAVAVVGDTLVLLEKSAKPSKRDLSDYYRPIEAMHLMQPLAATLLNNLRDDGVTSHCYVDSRYDELLTGRPSRAQVPVSVFRTDLRISGARYDGFDGQTYNYEISFTSGWSVKLAVFTQIDRRMEEIRFGDESIEIDTVAFKIVDKSLGVKEMLARYAGFFLLRVHVVDLDALEIANYERSSGF